LSYQANWELVSKKLVSKLVSKKFIVVYFRSAGGVAWNGRMIWS